MRVFVEVGNKRVFASALDWPGWCRSARTEDLALATLAAYLDRYARVARSARVDFPVWTDSSFVVVERAPGRGHTDFGVPGETASAESQPTTPEQAERLATLVAAAWVVFDEVAAVAPAELRKGPRGGGRDRDQVVDHVLAADTAYARNLGLKHRQPARGDEAAIATLRQDMLAALGKPSDGSPLSPRGWRPRYAARRIAWHALDHAWEIEDRAWAP
ncbi:MAG: hypothetical protein M3336_03715 [Chloroflexota bacterium]|nr:hypothetical protein [Chloroflexota bacterium]